MIGGIYWFSRSVVRAARRFEGHELCAVLDEEIIMNKSIREIMGVLSVVSAFIGVMLFATSQGWAQGVSAKQLVWNLDVVSVDNVRPRCTKAQPFGPNPKGLVISMRTGAIAYLLTLLAVQFAANNREQGTPEENKATVHAKPRLFRHILVSDKTLIFKIEATTYPNGRGTEQKRSFTLTGDD